MTYCVGILLESGMVFASDSRTNAGVDHISTFSKMKVFEQPGDRCIIVLTSGNLSVRREGTPTRYLISASGGSKSELTTEDFLLFEVGLRRLDGNWPG